MISAGPIDPSMGPIGPVMNEDGAAPVRFVAPVHVQMGLRTALRMDRRHATGTESRANRVSDPTVQALAQKAPLTVRIQVLVPAGRGRAGQIATDR